MHFKLQLQIIQVLKCQDVLIYRPIYPPISSRIRTLALTLALTIFVVNNLAQRFSYGAQVHILTKYILSPQLNEIM